VSIGGVHAFALEACRRLLRIERQNSSAATQCVEWAAADLSE